MVDLCGGDEDQLLSKAMRIPKLQYLTNRVLSQPSCAVDVSEAFELILAAEEVDRELANWARQIPVEWSYTIVTRMRYSPGPHLSRSNFVLSQIQKVTIGTMKSWVISRRDQK